MSIKTNKSYSKRLKVTKNGKILARMPGQNHFNAKERSSTRGKKRRMQGIEMTNKHRGLFLATK